MKVFEIIPLTNSHHQVYFNSCDKNPSGIDNQVTGLPKFGAQSEMIH